ncbi:MAG: membrane protein [Bdellovibrio sp. ArHS]|uniref:OmpA family protein n=1 Tax=Bdellovibrio sp. ArHS TaxID=1569284 RepID=UPI0005828C9A|nr:OmpA family protein [Bdellovibrio sp. ArHS]KHD88396.1 MAG: membrane protein [Bdellovibrio sp. ArHS]
MRSRISKYFAALVLTLAAAGCATTPPNVTSIPSSANPTTEIEKTDQLLKEAQDRQVDALSPENYADAQKALHKAKEKKAKNKSNEDILKQVSYSRAWLDQANAKAELAQTSMKDITDARAGALRAGAPQMFEKDWKKADKQLEDITKSIEKGNLKPADKKGEELTAYYRDLEIQSVKKSHLEKAEDNIKAAKKDGADKRAPRTYSLAEMKFENADKLIHSDPRNSEAIRRASEDATRESIHLLEVTRKVNAGNTEDLVLLSERQQRTISSLRNEYSSTEQELQQSQHQLSQSEQERVALVGRQAELEKTQIVTEKADKLRSQFKPNEAEVYVENGKVMVRLKGLQFASNKSTLNPKSQALLKKVDTALSEIDANKVTIEGHTDSTGSWEKNKELAEKRAAAVEKYLVVNGAIAEEKVDAVGVGPEKPISDNTTPQGRAQNRRIDLVIE